MVEDGVAAPLWGGGEQGYHGQTSMVALLCGVGDRAELRQWWHGFDLEARREAAHCAGSPAEGSMAWGGDGGPGTLAATVWYVTEASGCRRSHLPSHD
jgi:hypothetical protein